MKPIWFVIWAVVVGQFVIWTFAPGEPKAVEVNTGDGQPYGYLEHYLVESREGIRKNAMETLDQPWSSRCGEGRKTFIGGVSNYYWQRKNENERYAEIHGKPGADYIAKAWSSPDDRRIDRLTQEAYVNGYLRPADFKGYSRDLITQIVRDERATGKGCAG
jgi:hypothetical protein